MEVQKHLYADDTTVSTAALNGFCEIKGFLDSLGHMIANHYR